MGIRLFDAPQESDCPAPLDTFGEATTPTGSFIADTVGIEQPRRRGPFGTLRMTTAFRRTRTGFFWAFAGAVFMATVVVAGVGIPALVGTLAPARTWTLWGNVGQTFGSINTVFSGLAFIALVVTFLMQLQELRMQRTELYVQRDAMTKSHNELRRSAEADLRMLHMELIKM